MKPKTENPAAVSALLADDRDGILVSSAFAEHTKPSLIALGRASLGIALLTFGVLDANGQSWDDSTRNPYVAAGYGRECTAFAWGRYKTLNGEALTFTRPNGSKGPPHGGLMVPYADETTTSYRDAVPVRGALVSWTYGEYGHVGIVENLTVRSGKLDSVTISEQNWPIGAKPASKNLTSKELAQRGSYSLVGFLNPNRPPSIGSITTSNSGGELQVSFPILDEDNRQLRLLVALTDQNNKVLASRSGNVPANRTISSGVSGLRSGTTYCWYVWAWDFRGLRGVNSKTFKW